jgi:hypothetical protein
MRDAPGWGSQRAPSQAAMLAYIDDFLLMMALVVAIPVLGKPRPAASAALAG